jgi:hypothetical protein
MFRGNRRARRHSRGPPQALQGEEVNPMSGRHTSTAPVLGGDVTGLVGALAAMPLDHPVAEAIRQALWGTRNRRAALAEGTDR